MHSLTTFLASSSLAALDLLILALATRKLGARPKQWEVVLLALGVALKMGVLVLGCWWISRQSWYERNSLLAGLVAPFLLFIAWQALRLQLRHGKRA